MNAAIGSPNRIKWAAALALCLCAGALFRDQPGLGALDGMRYRVLVSTDVGGTDPDDYQSLVHFLLYADLFDVEGIVSSPYGPGRRESILRVIDKYELDFPALLSHSPRYPSAARLRAISKQGAIEATTSTGFDQPTEGSRWIVECARRPDPRPLHVLVWGGIEDLAQALHDAPDILPKLRVYFIGGPNKMWSVHAYDYIERNHPKLWIIENNTTYRGWFVGGNQSGGWGNRAFVSAHIAGNGALASFFTTHLKGTIKMGDSPSVGWLLHGTPGEPTKPGWGGRFVRLWEGRKTVFDRLTTENDRVEAFGVVEFVLPPPAGMKKWDWPHMVFDGRIKSEVIRIGPMLRFRFSPRDAKVWPYLIESTLPELNGKTGKFTAVHATVEKSRNVSQKHPNWWTDDPDPSLAEGIHPGARSVSQHRERYLADFARRIQRCRPSNRPPAGL